MRVTTGVKIHGTKSFRLACSKLLSHYGTNLQNPPPSLLRCITPDRGYCFVQVDQAGAESLIVSYLSQPGRYRALIENDIKQHSYVAYHIFPELVDYRSEFSLIDPARLAIHPDWKPKYAKVIKNSGYKYFLGKKVNHARSYKMKWPTFQLSVLKDTDGKIALSSQEAKKFLNTWDELFPEVISWQDEIEHVLNTTRTLYNLFGYPRVLHERLNDSLVREAISWIPQSTVGCNTHQAVIKTSAFINDSNVDWSILNNKHDSYLTQVPESEAMQAAELMKSHINTEFIGRDGVKFRMKSEAAVGYNWDKYDKESNPNGMKEIS